MTAHTIKLKGGDVTVVDEDIAKNLGHFMWKLDRKGYVWRRSSGAIYLHRVVINAKPREIVDHINMNKLDNRRENLRIVTASQSSINRGLPKRNASGYRGVAKHKQTSKWQAQIGFTGKYKYLGLFETAKEAALAYDAAARELHGDFAMLNFTEASHE